MSPSFVLCVLFLFAGPRADGGGASLEGAFPPDPLSFGRSEIVRALDASGLAERSGDVTVRIAPSVAPESFVIRCKGGKADVTGTDPAGAMYGALELAERILFRGAAAFDEGRAAGKPWLRDRGLNLFLTLPFDYEKSVTDRDPAALVDPGRWWFQNDGYWTTLLDEMARARLNWLDLHGTWDIDVTNAPNLYAYFIQSDRFPEVGVKPAIKAACLDRLRRVIAMAHARGVRVSLMAYEARFAIPQNPHPPYEATEENLYAYTREVVEKTIRLLPGLDAIGFRIGESGRGGEFFKCYIEAVAKSGRDIPLLTRSWVTRKAKVVPLARESSDFTVEIKYNGEQWAAPYLIAGGRVPGWYSYSFEDYLSDSGKESARRMWPGNPAVLPGALRGKEARWPGEPYKIVWQVRANGTHRIFPFYNPEWVRRSIRSMKIGTASGFTVEPFNAYYPKSPRYYLADPADQWCRWIHQRDAMYIMLWGRLGYDPETPTETFDALLARKLGPGREDLAAAWKRASRVVPTAFCAYSLGPDHRSHAPELEWGGGMESFVVEEPFDSHSFLSNKEAAALLAAGGVDGRLRPADAAAFLSAAGTGHDEGGLRPGPGPEPEKGTMAREVWIAVKMLGHLADYYANRMLAASWWASPLESGPDFEKARLAAAAGRMQRALAAWKGLSDSPEARFYKPFTERLRMHTNAFHWKKELPLVMREAAKYAALVREAEAEPAAGAIAPKAPPPATARLDLRLEGEDVVCTVPAKGFLRAWLLAKPLPSGAFFHKKSMARVRGEKGDEVFEARFRRENWGHAVAAEVEYADSGSPSGRTCRRIPLWEKERPYLVVPGRKGPTPPLYSSQEAMTFLDPEVLDPGKYGLLLLCSRAWDFHRRFSVPVKRKLLDAVRQGLDLLVLQQDFTSGRYPLDWFPDPPRVVNAPSRLFDPGGALGLEPIEAEGILWQPFRPAPGWELFGNGGVARYRLGKGSVWMVQARLMQNMHLPSCAKALAGLLSMGGREKPVVVVDAGTEGAHYATSVFTDMMNSLDIPFLTLGEVIAKEQGPEGLTPVPGRSWDDRVLEGRGPAMMKKWLEAEVEAAAHRPAPASREAFEKRRARGRCELMRCLGLDPLPPRTPLKARVTGVIPRKGYRIEKILFESRPRFPVTANLYVPEGKGPFPVIMNPHGHWRFKKAEPCVQKRAACQALRGYLSMVVDSPGHSFEGDAPIERAFEGTHFDLRTTLGSTNATTAYVWDLMRALDYLETRPEADLSRVGITGASGGGLATVYAFACDERFTAAVPVCYASSLEVNPHNGCPCNHIPGTLRIGDRADVLALRAPAPIFVIGAGRDPEFPPEGTILTGKKLKAIWSLFGAAGRVSWRIFESGHDYNKAMREAAMGFFDHFLKGAPTVDPVEEPEIEILPPDSRELFCLKNPPALPLTLESIAAGRLADARPLPFDAVAALNGGLPERIPVDFTILGAGESGAKEVTFRSEPGVTVPGLLLLPEGKIEGGVVLLSEKGKRAALTEFPVKELLRKGVACLAVDARGFGELTGLDPRLLAYLGTAAPFLEGWDAARAAEAMRSLVPRVAVVGRGACLSQAALFAALFDPRISFVAGLDGIRSYGECFSGTVPLLAVQPRAAYGAPLEHLRSLVKQPALFTFTGGKEPDLAALVAGAF